VSPCRPLKNIDRFCAQVEATDCDDTYSVLAELFHRFANRLGDELLGQIRVYCGNPSVETRWLVYLDKERNPSLRDSELKIRGGLGSTLDELGKEPLRLQVRSKMQHDNGVGVLGCQRSADLRPGYMGDKSPQDRNGGGQLCRKAEVDFADSWFFGDAIGCLE
jgi:hypothetical protein